MYFAWVVETFLKAGIALAKSDYLRPLLEKHGTRLGSRSLLSQLIPVVLAKENDTVKSALSGQSLLIVFDGSTRLGETVVVCRPQLEDLPGSGSAGRALQESHW